MLRKGVFFPVIILFTLLFAGCGSDGSGEGGDNKYDSCPNFYCPSIEDNVTWDSYGGLQIGNFGNDNCAKKLISDCGWHVYQGHNGGYGDTLEVAPPGEEAVLRWAWNNFSWMYLFQGWQGSTAEGISMGSTLQEVQAAYPDLVYYYGNEYKLENPSQKRSSSAAYFYFENGVLVR